VTIETDNQPRLTVLPTGNVGIGTISPTAEFEVVGTVKTDELCFGTDCRTGWPTASGVNAGDITAALSYTPVSNVLPTGFALLGNGSGVAQARLLRISDIRSVSGAGTDAFLAAAGACSSGQALNYNSVNDKLECSAVSLTSAQVSAALGFTPASSVVDSQAANAIFAGPASGGAAAPGFRPLVEADIPTLSVSKIGSGVLGVASGGTGLSSLTTNQILYATGATTFGQIPTSNNSVLTTNGSGVPSFTALSGDMFSQYAHLAGRSGGQSLRGGSAAGEDLLLDSTSNAAKGDIVLNPSGGKCRSGDHISGS
jgi:hypothetical protein